VPTVLQLISSSGLYGAERVLLELASFLRDAGWRSIVGVLRGRDQRTVEVAEAARTGRLPTVELPATRQFDTRTLRHLQELVRAEGVDLIHCHGYKPDVLVALARLPEHVRRIATCHTWYSRTLRLMAYELLDKLALHRFDHVVVVAPQLMAEVAAAGIPPERRSLVENGVSAPRPVDAATAAALRAALGVAPEEKLLLRVGRLDLDKGNHVLLRALPAVIARVPVKLVFAGDGDERQHLEAQAAELHLDGRVVFAGYRRDIPDLLGASDLFVICSPKEGLPIVLLEAMGARLPIVTTAVGAIPSVIEHGVDGLLVPPDDAAALSAALLAALDAPDDARRRAESAHRRFLRDHSQEAMGREYVAIYRRVLGSGAPTMP